ncbi:sigma-54 interaction domain-containing protein [Sedimentibacter sp. MB31-C6]|uniref:sigma-54 interaction domain-containing protein n=1 Tax=Sedimentibacter sp. MB31-C6 TaxID=3109366 RepID=UPI002DDCFEFB|nr:sigma 54-interacting transcriptional regulator [Sedimentibacter sp. MB36-C1]WSI03855.1 sigma 54-interacting transcriptional regulator [Sedimentibacter sp. MB36-C1]
MDYKNIMKLISENIYSGIFIVDKKGIVIFYNKSANDLAGVNIENAIGKHILEIFPKLTNETSTIIRALTTGRGIKNYIQNYYNYQSKQVTILSTTIPYYENGQLEGAIEIFSDVDKYTNISRNGYNISNEVQLVEKANYTLDNIIGNSSEINKIKNKILKIANSKSPVLVYGETGTGKELLVQSIHNESYRRDMPFIAQNCAAIPETLLESILFGTTLGSFTGAKNSKGLIEAANGGTLFLDEINSMDITLQAKLLRFLEEGNIRRIGENKLRKVDVRVIAALNENPNDAITSGKIRKDLFFRLNVINFSLPPLRNNKEDIIELSNYFIYELNQELRKNIIGFSEEVLDFFYYYDWPGNTRELKHVIEHAMNITEKSILTVKDLPEYLIKSNEVKEYPNLVIKHSNQSLNEQLKQFEKRIICQALTENNHNITRTSKKLDIPRQTLYYKMDKLGIKVDKILDN